LYTSSAYHTHSLHDALPISSVDRAHEARIAGSQIFVGHAEASRQEAHRELEGFEATVIVLGLLEPLQAHLRGALEALDLRPPILDRKSTRLNSSHVSISYAV